MDVVHIRCWLHRNLKDTSQSWPHRDWVLNVHCQLLRFLVHGSKDWHLIVLRAVTHRKGEETKTFLSAGHIMLTSTQTGVQKYINRGGNQILDLITRSRVLYRLSHRVLAVPRLFSIMQHLTSKSKRLSLAQTISDFRNQAGSVHQFSIAQP